MTLARSRLPIMLASALLLPSCARSVAAYPSLAPRAIEKGDIVQTTGEGVATLDSAVVARVGVLAAQARQGDDAFAAAVRAGCGAIARGKGAADGSEGWIVAQQALTVIEAERGRTNSALDDLNAMALEQARLAEGGTVPVDLSPLLNAARDTAAISATQDARLADLRARGCPA